MALRQPVPVAVASGSSRHRLLSSSLLSSNNSRSKSNSRIRSTRRRWHLRNWRCKRRRSIHTPLPMCSRLVLPVLFPPRLLLLPPARRQSSSQSGFGFRRNLPSLRLRNSRLRIRTAPPRWRRHRSAPVCRSSIRRRTTAQLPCPSMVLQLPRIILRWLPRRPQHRSLIRQRRASWYRTSRFRPRRRSSMIARARR